MIIKKIIALSKLKGDKTYVISKVCEEFHFLFIYSCYFALHIRKNVNKRLSNQSEPLK